MNTAYRFLPGPHDIRSLLRKPPPEPAHTAGPWRLAEPSLADLCGASALVVADRPDRLPLGICAVWKTDDELPSIRGDTEAVSNLRLVAAAPEMLAMLERVAAGDADVAADAQRLIAQIKGGGGRAPA